jgi:PAS domain S-box-containing protein
MRKVDLKFFYLSLFMGILFSFVDAFLNHVTLKSGFWNAILFDATKEEIIFRFIATISLSSFGLFFSLYYSKSKRLTDENIKKSLEMHLIIDRLPIGIIVADSNGEVEFVNHQFLELSGYDREHFKDSENWFKLFYPDFTMREKVRLDWLKRINKKENLSELRAGIIREMYCNNSVQKTVSLSVTIVNEKIVVSILDITLIKQTENLVRDKEQQLRQIIDMVPHFIYVKDSNDNYQIVNKAVADYCETTTQEIEKSNNYSDPASEEDVKRFRDTDHQIVSGEVKSLEYYERINNKNGTWIECKTLKVPFYKKNSSETFVLGVSINVTDLKKIERELLEKNQLLQTEIANRIESEKKLRETKETLRNIIENSTNMFYTHNIGHTVTYVSPQVKNLIGYEVEEALVRWTEFLTDNPVNQKGLELTQKAIDTGIAQPVYEMELRHRDGHQIWVEVRESPIVINGRTEMIVGALADITARKEAELVLQNYQNNLEKIIEERTKSLTESQIALTYLLEDVNESQRELEEVNANLRLANKELESFSYSISHDLRTPLRAINGFSKLITEEYASLFDKEAMRLFDVIRENSMMMSNLIDDLLAFSRLGRETLVKTDTDMTGLVKTELINLFSLDDNDKIEINIEDLPEAYCDTSLMRQVWANLLSNALKYSSKEEKPQIRIGSLESDNDPIYFVQDNGVGFDMTYVDKLFGVFQRLHSIKEFEGTGVGLAITHRIVTKHGGRIWADSKLGEGSTFYFSISKAGA